ncbi:MAG: hypothetical protein JRK53_16985 [Deltaproteobacteria bacterium]|nr:hypothetical protein [Deltaproteobacteria bacterium]MBW1817072.1 hypothetical protein [Deltaproteobacteria bacterium]
MKRPTTQGLYNLYISKSVCIDIEPLLNIGGECRAGAGKIRFQLIYHIHTPAEGMGGENAFCSSPETDPKAPNFCQ